LSPLPSGRQACPLIKSWKTVSYAKGDFRGIGTTKKIGIPNFLLPFCPQNTNFRLSFKKGSVLPDFS
jgi:hypothetical protein